MVKKLTGYFYFDTFQYSENKGLLCNGIAVPIAPRVEALLRRLLEADGDFVEKHELLALVPETSGDAEAALARTIYLLRKALGDKKGEIIQTAYGRGSRIVLPITHSAEPPGPATAMPPSPHEPRLAIPHIASGEDMIRTAFELAAYRTDRQLKLAAAVLENALERFPKLALAPALQADVEIARMIRGYQRATTAAVATSALVDKALSIHPGLPSALATKGWLMGATGDDLAGGLNLIDMALAAAPHLWLAAFYKTWLLIAERRLDAAQLSIDLALATSPLERGLLALKAWLLIALHQYDTARSFIEDSLALRPDVELLLILRSVINVVQGKYDAAYESMNKALKLYPEDTFVQANLAWVQAATGDAASAISFVARMGKSSGTYVSPVKLAMVRRALGDEVGANNALLVAANDKDPWRLLAWCDPRLSVNGYATSEHMREC